MTEKVNLSTPPAIIWDTMIQEYQKVIRWYNKKVGGQEAEDALRHKIGDKVLADPDHEARVVFQTEWVSPETQNRWLPTHVVYTPDGELIGSFDWCPLFYESHGSIGAFMSFCVPDGTTFQDGIIERPKKLVILFTSHFFLRYCDDQRQLGTMHEDKTQVLTDFFRRNMTFLHNDTVNVYRGKSGRLYVDACFSGCLARGRVVEDGDVMMYEFDTCLSWQMLNRKQYRHSQSIIDAWEHHLKELSTPKAPEDDGIPEWKYGRKFVDTSFENRYDLCSIDKGVSAYETKSMRKYFGLSNSTVLRELTGWSCVLLLVLNRISGHDNNYHPSHAGIASQIYRCMLERGSCAEEWNRMQPSDLTMLLSDISEMINLKYNGEDRKVQLEDIVDYVSRTPYTLKAETYDELYSRTYKSQNNNNQTVQTMNPNQITEFKTLIKKQFKSFDKYVKKYINLEYDSYLRQVEPLFAISRIQPAITAEKDKAKAAEAQRLWIEKVVDNRWCSCLDRYINDLGKELVTLSIHYMIENNVWQSPVGKNQLQSKGWDYSSLDDIAQAATCICENEGIDPNPEDISEDKNEDKNENENANGNDETTMVEFTDVLPSDDLHVSISEAEQELKTIGICLSRLTQSASRLKNFVNNADPDIDKSQQATANLLMDNERLQRQLETKKQEVDSIKAERDENQRIINELRNSLNAANQAYTRIEAERNEWLKTRKEQADALKAANETIADLRKQQTNPEPATVTYDEMHAACPFVSIPNFRAIAAFMQKRGICKITGVE